MINFGEGEITNAQLSDQYLNFVIQLLRRTPVSVGLPSKLPSSQSERETSGETEQQQRHRKPPVESTNTNNSKHDVRNKSKNPLFFRVKHTLNQSFNH